MRLRALGGILLLSMLIFAPPMEGWSKTSTRARQPAQAFQGPTQAQMDDSANGDADKAEAEMSSVLSEILKKHAKDPVFVAKMKASQKAWLAYRAAYIESVYPAADKQLEYGTSFPVCAASVQADLTRARTEQLRQWLKPAEEGDLCSGSMGG